MILHDSEIVQRYEDGQIDIDPFDAENVQPCSYDVHLADTFKRPHPTDDAAYRLGNTDPYEYTTWTNGIVVGTNEFVLASTDEYIDVPTDMAVEVCGRSSLGRLGITVHQTAGYVDAGFSGEVTLEVVNNGSRPVELRGGDRVAQLVFYDCTGDSAGYDGAYTDQRGPQPSASSFE